MPRFRITSLIVLVALIGGGLGAMRYASEFMTKGFTSVLTVAMLVGLTGAIILRRGAWIGFAVFIVGYAGPFSIPYVENDLGELLITNIAEGFHPNKIARPSRPTFSSPYLPPRVVSMAIESSELEAINDRPMLEADLGDDQVSHTDSELKTLKVYQSDLKLYHEKARLSKPRQDNAIMVGKACLALVLGWIGAIVGQSLEERRLSSPPSRPLKLKSTTTP